ncbi:G-type lectin S-receptor-like serine/threonine-protein kinase LECRK2 [Elaeis guineensis]|uniref:Receptor-like serine/threonine-protein kinase n=1 Tax=Elaeis guineensis var. tenera TaxID=51953 RepID=A0A6I9RUD1_ELAGV|nr:G-type lectin S-receptor-like serine/threonine-protein kinase LECRK2 [Elaeis guineensis]
MASSSLFLQFLVPLLLPLLSITPSYAQSHRDISLGTSLISTLGQNTSWLSPSGEFAFGFHPLETDRSLFLLAIWFEKIAQKTVVWYANGGKPVQYGSMVELTADGQLLLKDHNGQELWNAGKNASYAAMLDTGNFVLVGTHASVVWQSFDTPTDTILPSQVLHPGTELHARLTATNYSSGRFELRFEDDGNLVLYTVAVPSGNQYDPYWTSDTIGNGSQLVFNESGRIYLAEKNGSISNFTSGSIGPMEDFYQRATLDFDGVFRQYVYPRKGMRSGSWNDDWTSVDAKPTDICQAIAAKTGSGACGYNSYCTIDERQHVDCECPPSYSFFDPNRTYKGCMPDFAAQSCDADAKEIESLYGFKEMIGLDWPLSDYEQLYPIEEDQCRKECLSDCFCVAATYNINDRNCSKMKAPLSNGKKGSYIHTKSLIKVPRSTQSPPPIPTVVIKDKNSWTGIRSLLLGGSALINILLIAAVLLLAFYSYKKRIYSLQPNSSETGTGLRSFTYRELQEATNNFSEQLDYGGLGGAYKGCLRDEASTFVAVKRVGDLLPDSEVEFINLIKAIGQASHKNLVRLLGFCNEGTERFLVYEFLSTGPLKSFLFRSIRLKWNQRVQVALGIARGLLYLHEECGTQIIHCDIQPRNILLDDNFVAKISNFELGKLLREDQARVTMAVRGTVGYIAPEWFQNMGITAKVDVYSFGVTLLEIICCRKVLEPVLENDEAARLTDWVNICYRNGRLDMVVGGDEEVRFDMGRVERFVAVALWCVQEEPSLRPTMWKVTQMLDGAATVPVPPDPSSYISSIQ